MKPIPTTAIAVSLSMPKMEQARGMSISEPPATPLVPQAARTETTQTTNPENRSIWIPFVATAAMVMTIMVTAAPAMLMVHPRGIEIE